MFQLPMNTLFPVNSLNLITYFNHITCQVLAKRKFHGILKREFTDRTAKVLLIFNKEMKRWTSTFIK